MNSPLVRHSFNEAVEYKNLITKVRASEDVPVILVGNKVPVPLVWFLIIKSGVHILSEKEEDIFPTLRSAYVCSSQFMFILFSPLLHLF